MKKYYTIQEVAKTLGLTESKVYYEIEVGRLKAQELAGRKVVYAGAIAKLRKTLIVQKVLPTPAEYCKKNKMSRSKFDHWVRAGKIKVARVGGKVFVKGGRS